MSFTCRLCKQELADSFRGPNHGLQQCLSCKACLAERARKRREARADGMRWCSGCDSAKPETDFSQNSPEYRSHLCHSCAAAKMKARKHAEREQLSHLVCTACKERKPAEEFGPHERHRATTKRCKQCEATRRAMGRTSNSYKFGAARFTAKRRGLDWSLAFDEYVSLRSLPCHYCGFSLPDSGGLDRIDDSKGYHPGNVVPCCTECNLARGVLLSYDEMKRLIGPAMAQVKRERIERGETPVHFHGWGRPRKYDYALPTDPPTSSSTPPTERTLPFDEADAPALADPAQS